MKKIKYGFLIVLVIVITGLVLLSRNQAINLTHNPKADRLPLTFSPSDLGLEYKDVTVVNDIGQILHGWYIPPKNGAVIMLLHGYKSNRGELGKLGEFLVHHDYGVLFISMRSNDINDGELITFGLKEMPDLDAWYEAIKDKKEVKHIGMFGNSLGGYLAIQYAASNKNIEAVITQSAFSSMKDTLDTSIKFFTGLPPVLFSPLIEFWADREIDGKLEDVNAKKWIGRISQRPIFIMQGGADKIISPESGEWLYEAAKEPREFWFEPELGHVEFPKKTEEFEKRVLGFFDRYLLNKE